MDLLGYNIGGMTKIDFVYNGKVLYTFKIFKKELQKRERERCDFPKST